ncbi:MAG: hypothetical protein IRZ14_20230 [Chloroflexi bacterium]|nr:hypothetical protein [Chloroflexota bacterium]
MATTTKYYALTSLSGDWEIVGIGSHPNEVEAEAERMIVERYGPLETARGINTNTDTALKNLRVVPADEARERYQLVPEAEQRFYEERAKYGGRTSRLY